MGNMHGMQPLQQEQSPEESCKPHAQILPESAASAMASCSGVNVGVGSGAGAGARCSVGLAGITGSKTPYRHGNSGSRVGADRMFGGYQGQARTNPNETSVVAYDNQKWTKEAKRRAPHAAPKTRRV